MTTTLHKLITLAEFLKLPETKPASEFIRDRIYQKPMPQGKHSRLQLKLCDAVNQVAEEGRIALAFPELRCTYPAGSRTGCVYGGRSIVPDVTVFSWQRIPFDTDAEIENVFETYPDLTIEILSPAQKATRVISNILHCLKHGTQLGWFVDPDERSVLAFLPEQQPTELTGDDRLLMPEFLKLDLTVAHVFSWLKPGK